MYKDLLTYVINNATDAGEITLTEEAILLEEIEEMEEAVIQVEELKEEVDNLNEAINMKKESMKDSIRELSDILDLLRDHCRGLMNKNIELDDEIIKAGKAIKELIKNIKEDI